VLKSQLYFVLNLRNLDIKETENTAIRGMVANDEESASIKAKTSYCTFLIGKIIICNFACMTVSDALNSY